ncbi:MAG: hypothetical protein ACYS1A_06965 [Planctomycetota bacterium]|jgi:hypothetical protein
MAVEAPISKFKKTNLKIYICACVVGAIIFGYDGYLSKYEWSKRHNFYKKNVIDNGGKPTSTMSFNRKSPPVFAGAAILLGAYLFLIRNKKLVADENALVLSKYSIAYDSIEKIDKTHFDSKGFFIVTYKDVNGNDADCKISNRTYDNLAAVLEHLVAKIT